jgi:hypothetical protein
MRAATWAACVLVLVWVLAACPTHAFPAGDSAPLQPPPPAAMCTAMRRVPVPSERARCAADDAAATRTRKPLSHANHHGLRGVGGRFLSEGDGPSAPAVVSSRYRRQALGLRKRLHSATAELKESKGNVQEVVAEATADLQEKTGWLLHALLHAAGRCRRTAAVACRTHGTHAWLWHVVVACITERCKSLHIAQNGFHLH